jgi:hypothetical protein
MTTLQKKQKLIEEAEKLTDSDFIDYLLRLIELESDTGVSKIYPLSEMEREAIDKAEEDIKAGNVLTEVQADEQINPWL